MFRCEIHKVSHYGVHCTHIGSSRIFSGLPPGHSVLPLKVFQHIPASHYNMRLYRPFRAMFVPCRIPVARCEARQTTAGKTCVYPLCFAHKVRRLGCQRAGYARNDSHKPHLLPWEVRRAGYSPSHRTIKQWQSTFYFFRNQVLPVESPLDGIACE